jgi:serine/threonine protein kinase/Tol biopolymer transport system component
LTPGTIVGSYEVVSLLGAGGMGEVYRARDTRLGRDVALKLLPAALADDPERVARFQREAQVLASLNHPHIGTIYGLEQLPSARFLVLELVEGGTLANRLERGPIPYDDALEIARQIALALQAAHDKGVVHRDLKPSNVAFTLTGDVKVLDFGLAKLGDAGERPITSASLSPTITSPALMTGVGTLLGTAAYMAPEQAKGKPADKRSDVWSFGCVLYEMLTGKRAFEGDDIADTLANVLKTEPDWTRLPATLTPAIRVLLRRCLAKDARQRCGDMAAVLILLEESTHLSPPVASSSAPAHTHALWQRVAVPLAIVIAAGLAATATWWARSEPPRVVRTSIVVTGSAARGSEIAITPDGTRIVYIGGNQTQLFVRALDELDSRLLVSGNNLRGVVASPDSQSVIYTDGNVFMKVALTGGAATRIAQVDSPSRGSTWLDDNTIVFATANGTTGLQRVAASGGQVTVLTKPDPQRGEADHLDPARLPDGRSVLFTITSNVGNPPQIAVMDLVTGERTILVRNASAALYVESGHLVYAAEGVLQAVPFDPGTRTLRGTPVPVLQQFAMLGNLNAVLDVAANGTLVYARGGATSRRPVWVDRDGREAAIKGPIAMYQTPRLSPDGLRLAYFEITSSGEYDVWILDIERGTAERLTTEPGRDSEPIWSPDSTRIAYLSGAHAGGPGIFIRRADGAGTVERLTTGVHLPSYWSADGKWVAYADFGDRGISVATVSALMMVDVDGDHTPRLLLKGSNGRIAPTERWVAVTSATTGTEEVYVLPFPDMSRARTRISTDGGQNPTWAPDGQTLFYRRGQALMAVSVSGDDPSAWPKAKMLFEGPYVLDIGPTHYDAARDGRLLMVKPIAADGEGAPSQLVVVQNWFEELRRLVPQK